MNWNEKLKVIFPLLRNKYIITGLIFLVWLGFFDQNNIVDRISLSSRTKELERQKTHYKQEIIENRRQMEELKGNTENIEKFAREQYMMKRPDEELFIIIEE
jgi:cell division protein DivIC